MNFLTAFSTDVGTTKGVNEDSLLIMEARTLGGNILLAAVCDGMGGLQRGDYASKAVAQDLRRWFYEELPPLVNSLNAQTLKDSWGKLITKQNEKIGEFAKENNLQCGTTATVLLLAKRRYYIAHVGDTRVYRLRKTIQQITKDQTLLQREIDAGNVNPADTKNDTRSNVLLQCVGASPKVVPRFLQGQALEGDLFVLCSDGFYKTMEQKEVAEAAQVQKKTTEHAMKQFIDKKITQCKKRGETDNITAVLVKLEK